MTGTWTDSNPLDSNS